MIVAFGYHPIVNSLGMLVVSTDFSQQTIITRKLTGKTIAYEVNRTKFTGAVTRLLTWTKICFNKWAFFTRALTLKVIAYEVTRINLITRCAPPRRKRSITLRRTRTLSRVLSSLRLFGGSCKLSVKSLAGYII